MKKQIDYWAKFEENSEYHIYNRSINKEKIFDTDSYCELFLKKCKLFILPYFEIHAFCLIPNHFHLLVKVKPQSDEIIEKIKYQGLKASSQFLKGEITYSDFLVVQFSRVFQAFATIYNQEEDRNGSLFQKRFKRILIKDEFKWRHILAYIHHNPIHHKYCDSYDNWRFSSYLVFLSNSPTLIARSKVLKRFDENLETAKSEFVKFHKNFKLEKELQDLYLH